jgi:hypothetical protein
MSDMFPLSIGAVLGFASIFYIFVKISKRRLRRYMLRFEEIKNKFE